MDDSGFTLAERVSKFWLGGKAIRKKHLDIADVVAALEKIDPSEEISDLKDVNSLKHFLESGKIKSNIVFKVLCELFPDINKNYYYKITDKSERIKALFLLSDLEKMKDDEITTNQDDETTPNQDELIDNLPTLTSLMRIYQTNSHQTIDCDCNSEMKVYGGFGITKHDNFYFVLGNNAPKDISTLCAILVKPTTKGKIGAVGRLLREGDKLYFVADSKGIYKEILGCNNLDAEFIFFPKSAENFLHNKGDFTGNVYIVTAEVEYENLPDADQVLCVDFGTSNTTAGTYFYEEEPDNQIQLVEFFDVLTGKYQKMIPTIVCVDTIENSKPKFLFGYEAVKRLRDKDFRPRGSVFREIKRWMGDLDGTVGRIYGEDGSYCDTVKKGDIIREYIHYVIRLAEEYFKLSFKIVHFTTPVRTQKDFLEKFESMLPKNYSLKKDQCVNEAIAVIYGKLRDKIQQEVQNEEFFNESRGITVIDCGGGTTDVAHCTYQCRYKNKKNLAANILEITTNFQGGDSDYAGNNITYRILQLLKIKAAGVISKQKETTADKLFDYSLESILTMLDGKNKNPDAYKDIYEKFVDAYNKAEQILPTKFGNKGISREHREKFKRNYYYLWEIAESLKHKFFTSDKATYEFSKDKDLVSDINGSTAAYKLWVRNDGSDELQENTAPLKNVTVTISEIRRILYGDIYNLLVDIWPKGVLAPDNEQFYLSGQSCRISLFNELIKEFIPGQKLRDSVGDNKDTSDTTNAKNLGLKLRCIIGSIKYIMDVYNNVFKPELKVDTPRLNYYIEEASSGKNEKRLSEVSDKNDKNANLIIKPFPLSLDARHVELKVYGKNKVCINTIQFKLDEIKNSCGSNISDEMFSSDALKDAIKSKTYEDYWDVVGMATKEITSDKIPSDCYCVILLPDKSGFGFDVCLFAKEHNKENNLVYKYLGDKYYPYETKNETFFEGNR